MTINLALRNLASLLYGKNYAVFLRLDTTPFVPGKQVEQYVISIFGQTAEVGGTHATTSGEVLETVEQSLRYAGDDSHGPSQKRIESAEFNELMESILRYFEQSLTEAMVIEEFWFKKGHPAYPVFWDFAFVILKAGEVEIFVGSSSD